MPRISTYEDRLTTLAVVEGETNCSLVESRKDNREDNNTHFAVSYGLFANRE